MKKLLITLFSVLLLSSFCFAEEAPVIVPGDHGKVVENKKQDVAKKSVKPKMKRLGKKIQKKNGSAKK